ncbi:hypothetical protein D3C84_1275640 [compost metagenome]
MAGALQQLAAPAAPSFPDLGTVNFNIGGQTVQTYATPSMAEELHRLALKHGRTGPKR